ncbi:TPA: hypothetical protein U2E05_000868 [Streptococcus suis]|nr:hypothetical protein [Streptococcus suis]
MTNLTPELKAINERIKAFNAKRQQKTNKPMIEIKTTNNAAGYAVGDILYISWGYEQTNIDFYQVMKTTKNSISILKIKSQTVEEVDYMVSEVKPSINEFASFDIFNENHNELKPKRVMTNKQYQHIGGHMLHRYEGKALVESSYY